MYLAKALLPVGLLCLLLTGPSRAQAQYYDRASPFLGRWLIGLGLGHGWVDGDIHQVIPGFQVNLYAQRTVARAFDVHIDLGAAQLSGQALDPMHNVRPNPALNGSYNPGFAYDTAQAVYPNFRLRGGDLSLSGRLQLSRLFSREGQENWDFFIGAGAGAQFYRTRTDAYDEEAGTLYPYDDVSGSTPAEVRQALVLMRDGTYETIAERDIVNSTFVEGFTINSTFLLSTGLRFQLGDQIGIGAEGRMLFPSDDLLDGLQWDEQGAASPDNDRIIRITLTLDFVL
ncbi:MAG: hypothetical protein D6722_16385 [Bacteroidetes bacterium]|nr:MAG: hypothetical protein D6722_16385 [Bacteroidota bacterium]